MEIISSISKPMITHVEETPIVKDFTDPTVGFVSTDPGEGLESSNLSMESLILNNYDQSEELQKNYLNYLYQKKNLLNKDLMEAKDKIIEIHKNSASPLSLFHPYIETGILLCNSMMNLSLGLSLDRTLSKIVAVSTSLLGFSMAGLKMIEVEIPKYIPQSYMTIFNIYMAYKNPKDAFTYIRTFLQILPSISQFSYDIDNNSMCSEEALAQKTIQVIEQDLKNLTLEISRAMKMIETKRKLYSMTTDYTQLYNRMAAIPAG